MAVIMASGSYREFIRMLKGGDFEEAVRFAEKKALTEQGGGFWLTQQAVALLWKGDFVSAYDTACRALQRVPGNHFALRAKADAALKCGKFTEAEGYYRELLDEERFAAAARRGLLECRLRRHEWEEILSLCAQWSEAPALELIPWRTRALKELGRTDEALAECRQWLKMAPENRQALWALTELEIDLEGLEAVRERMKRLSKIPKMSIYAEIYASLCRRSGSVETALRQYSRLAERESDPRIIRQQAFSLAKTGREAEALPLMEELLRLNPRDNYIHSSYVAACRRISEVGRGVEFYEELLAKFPGEKGLYGRIKRLLKDQPGTAES